VRDRPRLLVRDLDQVATVPATAQAPLRGGDLAGVEVIDGAYVLCADGRIAEVGRMAELGSIDGDVEELDGSGR
jgi:imidazolonepropionase-like amidohydrolase